MNTVTKITTIITALVIVMVAITPAGLNSDDFAAFAWDHHHYHHLWEKAFEDEAHDIYLHLHHHHHDWED